MLEGMYVSLFIITEPATCEEVSIHFAWCTSTEIESVIEWNIALTGVTVRTAEFSQPVDLICVGLFATEIFGTETERYENWAAENELAMRRYEVKAVLYKTEMKRYAYYVHKFDGYMKNIVLMYWIYWYADWR